MIKTELLAKTMLYTGVSLGIVGGGLVLGKQINDLVSTPSSEKPKCETAKQLRLLQWRTGGFNELSIQQ